MRLTLMSIFFLISFNCYSQSKADFIDLSSLKIGQNNLSQDVDLKLPNSKGNLNKEEAFSALEDFYNTNSFDNYTLKHNGGSSKGNLFEIGSLKSKNSSFRTYVLFKKVDGEIQIIELRIEEE